MSAATRAPSLDSAAAHWQWALDAAARALDADRLLLPPGEAAAQARHLTRERQETNALLRRVAVLAGANPAPWLAPGQVTPRMLGLPGQIRACLFDLDGVLTDSDALHAAAWAQALDTTLLAIAHEERRPFVPFDVTRDYHAYFDGRQRSEGIQLFFAGRGIQLTSCEIDAIAQRKGDLLEHGLARHGVAALEHAHRYLQAAGLTRLQRCVVSASMTAEPMLGLAALTGLVDISIDAHAMRRQGLRSRPAPDLLLAVCRRLHIDPAAAVSLTHSGPGVIAALEIDMPVIGVAAGPEAHGLHELGAGTVVPTLGALLDPSLRAS